MPPRLQRQESDAVVQTVVRHSAPIEKLRGAENWKTWKFSVRLGLGEEELLHCIAQLPDEAIRADKTHPDMKKDGRAYSLICTSLESAVMVYVMETTYAKEAWDALLAVYEDRGAYRRAGLLYQLFETKQVNYKSLREYVMAVKDTVMSIKATGKPVVLDELVAVLLLWNLRPGPESRHLRQLVERSCAVAPEQGDEPMLQLNLVMGELLQEARIQEQEDKRDAGGKALKFGANTTPYRCPYNVRLIWHFSSGLMTRWHYWCLSMDGVRFDQYCGIELLRGTYS